MKDERLTSAAVTILKNESFTPNDIERWIKEFADWEKSEIWNEEYTMNLGNHERSLWLKKFVKGINIWSERERRDTVIFDTIVRVDRLLQL